VSQGVPGVGGAYAGAELALNIMHACTAIFQNPVLVANNRQCQRPSPFCRGPRPTAADRGRRRCRSMSTRRDARNRYRDGVHVLKGLGRTRFLGCACNRLQLHATLGLRLRASSSPSARVGLSPTGRSAWPWATQTGTAAIDGIEIALITTAAKMHMDHAYEPPRPERPPSRTSRA
jgi:hypothetical protein